MGTLQIPRILADFYKLAAPKFIPAVVNIPESVTITKAHKISVCTVSMNRLDQLKNTYLRNIEECAYSNVEFVLLDYNSTDGLGDWVCHELGKYIDSGKLVYYRTMEPVWFDNCHARNVAWRLAEGDLITNLDTDHLLGNLFLPRINALANVISENVIFVRSRRKIRGRIVISKNDFINRLKGFDEGLKGYSPWDRDIYNRALCLGFAVVHLGGNFGSNDDIYMVNHPDRNINYSYKDFNICMYLNSLKSVINLLMDNFVPNRDGSWGKANLIKNFDEKVSI